ncbi:hypothetical protein B14911_10332 [Bacillus sp. NRRL B-14911]|uniref:hypothetical protein n=1 Tax=Bacillus sp. NRRL B-14911 TaxID=313627 RepID=UPI00006B5988|nr:hypothetical protein [Bacillus sp. NRRL B-14911]EAR66124.1 hypothetical protein B14911_10332 [Bacillus sp. NRRL B-14911]
MFTELLWLYEAKLQYNRQKMQGLTGLVALLTVIFLVWKWNDWFYPLFKSIGLVGLAERTGLVSDLSVVTVINVLAIIFLLCLFFSVIALGVVLIGFLLLVFGASKIGQGLITLAIFPLAIPYFLFAQNKNRKGSLENYYRRHEDLKPLLKKHGNLDTTVRDFHLYIEQLKRNDSSVKVTVLDNIFDDAKKYLNQVIPSVKNNTTCLIGYQRNSNKYYVLFPNPLPTSASRSFDKSYKGEGLYGFISQCKDFYPISRLSSPSRYYVPGLPVTIRWADEKLSLTIDQSSKVQTLDINLLDEFYLFDSKEFSINMSHLVSKRDDLHEVMRRAHIAFYLLPIAYPQVDGMSHYGWSLFMKDAKEVLNADVLKPIYEADIQKEIIKHAKDGEKWAIKWFEKVD